MIRSDNAPDDLLKQVLIIWGILSPILAWSFGFFVKRCHIRYQTKRQNISQARDEFKKAFFQEIVLLRQDWKDWLNSNEQPMATRKIIKDAIRKHEKAWLAYRDPEFLSDKKQASFDRLWEKYSYQKARGNYFFYGAHKGVFAKLERRLGSTVDAENKIREVAIKRIYKMFDLTKL